MQALRSRALPHQRLVPQVVRMIPRREKVEQPAHLPEHPIPRERHPARRMKTVQRAVRQAVPQVLPIRQAQPIRRQAQLIHRQVQPTRRMALPVPRRKRPTQVRRRVRTRSKSRITRCCTIRKRNILILRSTSRTAQKVTRPSNSAR